LGLSQAGKIGAQAMRAYRNALQDALFPRLAITLENELRATLRSPRREDELAGALEAYLNLYDGTRINPQLVGSAVLRAWKLSDADSVAFLAHLRSGLEGGAPEMRHPQDEAIIKEARQKLAPAKNS
jgi:type VI protein secretion system component VasK